MRIHAVLTVSLARESSSRHADESFPHDKMRALKERPRKNRTTANSSSATMAAAVAQVVTRQARATVLSVS